MLLYLYRHGETAGNLEKRYIGTTDQPLCPEGIAHARRLGVVRQMGKVYTSGLLRTLQTAEIWFPEAELLREPALNEMDFGRFEGKNYRELASDPAYGAWLDSGCEAPCPGGESKSGFAGRVLAGWERIAGEAGDRAVLVVHSGTIMALMEAFAIPEKPYFEWSPGHCAGYLLDWPDGRWSALTELPPC